MFEENFYQLCSRIRINNINEIETTTDEIAKKLNSEYYNSEYYNIDGDKTSNMYIVGSIGRGSAIKNCSDVDLLFDLPTDVYSKFDAYESNGQSALLQEVKSVLEQRYPRTKMRGDGQVVVIEFDKYTVELVPGFKQSDNSFKYPDTHYGGSWKRTDPISEKNECGITNQKSNGIYFDFCRLIRAWKNQWGFKFGGLLIDTLVYNHFKENHYYDNSSIDDYFDILKNVLNYIKSQNKDQVYWYAVGSNQQVYNSENGLFVTKAKSAYEKLTNSDDTDDIIDALVDLFGNDIKVQNSAETNAIYKSYSYHNTEEFIENLYAIDIKYNLVIDCVVSQNGFRDFLLRHALLGNQILRHNKSLKFFIEKNEVPKPYDICWKVRNVGDVAEQKDQIRGQIKCTNSEQQIERTSFKGPHFVECYIIKNAICVARSRIDVPIGEC